jgi:hypothetical protein
MKTGRWSDEEVSRYKALRAEGKSIPEIAAALDRAYDSIANRSRYERVNNGVVVSPPNAPATDERCESLAGERLITLEELIIHYGIDTELWECREFVANKWETGAKHPETGAILIAPLFQIKAWFKHKPGYILEQQALGAKLLADIAALPKPSVARTFRAPRSNDWLFEYPPFDLHMGKYAWDEETVTNYDVDMAEDLFNASLDFLVSRATKLTDGFGRALCVFGNDAMHIDSKRGETTSGTHMDFDSRYIRVFRRCVAVHLRAIEVLRKICPVDIVVVPGNHDEHAAFHLGEIIATRYDGVKHVRVDNGAKLRKYYDFGVNLFGFAHGDKEKINELPLLMAREQPERWSRCTSREWHIGHKHIAEKKTWSEMPGVQDLFSDKGVRVRRLMSLSAHDAWHTNNAYTDRRACDAFIFHREAGFTDHLSFNVDHFTGKAVSV